MSLLRSAVTGPQVSPLSTQYAPPDDDLIGERVALNLQRLRSKRYLSLDALARLSGVSRAMLAQIESGPQFFLRI